MVVLLFGWAWTAPAATFFADPTKANVLRQYNVTTGVNLVPAATTVVHGSANLGREGVIDGSGWNDEGSGYNTSNDWIQRTFTLPGLHTVGSYMAQFDGNGRRPKRFVIEGNNGSGWVSLVDVDATTWGSERNTGAFTAGAYNQLRYTAYGPLSADTTFGLSELQVYMAAGQNVAVDSGYSLFRDQAPAGLGSSPKTGVWSSFNGGSGTTLGDADLTGNELKNQNGPNRAYMAYSLAAPQDMRFGTLGGNKGQGWGGNWEVYAANGATMPSLQALDASTAAAIQSGGWTLQYAYTSGSYAQAQDFAFLHPGTFQYLALVTDMQWPSATEFELFGLPEPASLVLLGGSLLLVSRRRR